MTRKQRIIFDDLNKHFRSRLMTVMNDFTDRCEESKMPDNDVRYAVTYAYMQMAIIVMEGSGFSPEGCAKFAYTCAKALAKEDAAEKS